MRFGANRLKRSLPGSVVHSSIPGLLSVNIPNIREMTYHAILSAVPYCYNIGMLGI